MKYIFNEKSNFQNQIGKYPIDYFHICWYDMEKGGDCYDEDDISPTTFGPSMFTYIDTEDNKDDSDRSRIFVHHINGDIYELCLHKLTEEQWAECSNFYGGRDR